jgi:hypothetical protein
MTAAQRREALPGQARLRELSHLFGGPVMEDLVHDRVEDAHVRFLYGCCGLRTLLHVALLLFRAQHCVRTWDGIKPFTREIREMMK